MSAYSDATAKINNPDDYTPTEAHRLELLLFEPRHGVFPISSTNGTAGATPPTRQPGEGLFDYVERCGGSGPNPRAPERALSPFQVGGVYDRRLNATADYKRDEMLSRLRKEKGEWSDSFWAWLANFKAATAQVFAIEDNDFNRYRVHNFKKCYWQNGDGYIYESHSRQNERYKFRISCDEPGCLSCEDKRRKKRAALWLDRWKQIIEKNPGCKATYHFVFTLPESVEAAPLVDGGAIQKKLLAGIQNIVRKMFGRPTGRPYRSNIPMNVSVHPVGDADLMRPRWHVHVDVLPCEIVKDGEGHRFFWVDLAKRAAGHSDYNPKVDLDWFRGEWGSLIARVFDHPLSPIYPQTEIVPFNSRSKFWKNRPNPEGKGFSERFFGKLGHKLKYNMRSFAGDFENAFLRVERETGDMLIKGAREDCGFFQRVTAEQLATRWDAVRSANMVRGRGFFQLLGKYAELLGIVEEDELPERPEGGFSYYPATMTITRDKVWCKIRKKWVWERRETWQWEDDDGRIRVAPGEEMDFWVWGDE